MRILRNNPHLIFINKKESWSHQLSFLISEFYNPILGSRLNLIPYFAYGMQTEMAGNRFLYFRYTSLSLLMANISCRVFPEG